MRKGYLAVPRWMFRDGKCRDHRIVLMLFALLARARTSQHTFIDYVTGRTIHLDVMEFVVGVRSLTKELGWSNNSVESALNRMIEFGWLKRWRVAPKMFVYRLHESFAEILIWSDDGPASFGKGDLERTWEKYKSSFNRRK